MLAGNVVSLQDIFVVAGALKPSLGILTIMVAHQFVAPSTLVYI